MSESEPAEITAFRTWLREHGYTEYDHRADPPAFARTLLERGPVAVELLCDRMLWHLSAGHHCWHRVFDMHTWRTYFAGGVEDDDAPPISAQIALFTRHHDDIAARADVFDELVALKRTSVRRRLGLTSDRG